MIEKNATYMVMGLLNTDSLAFTIGQRIAARGGRVVYTVQNETLRKRFLKESGVFRRICGSNPTPGGA